MRVFDFTLLSGYEFSGVDVAQGFRARLFAKNNVNAKFIFTELPTIRDMELYGSQKIKHRQIMSAHLFMTGRLDMSLSVKKEALLENEKENYEYDNIDEDGKVIRLYNSGEKSVEILCDEDGFVINESLFKNGKKYLENYYTDSFEGYNMMRKLGCPFMLITDPRLEGGAFYIDNADLEEKLFNNIEKTINEMKLKKSDVIISGMSMGTFGSLYFGSKLSPHALILAKPLTELGVVAENERLLRPGVFPTSLDLLLKNYGSLSKKSVEEFDKRMWERFDKADWSHTKFIASYLYEDDYDTDGYKNILEHLKSEGVEVYGKGSHGHHNDNRESVVGWFLSQYRLILEEDFNRK